jgi:hypothetical protein
MSERDDLHAVRHLLEVSLEAEFPTLALAAAIGIGLGEDLSVSEKTIRKVAADVSEMVLHAAFLARQQIQ